MRQFRDLDELAQHLAAGQRAMMQSEKSALTLGAQRVQARAQEKLGTYQGPAGPFAEWATLAHATLYGGVSPEGHRYPGKIKLGYATEAEHRPLERTGDLRTSIQYTIRGHEAQVGSNDQVAVWQELGTARMPARSFLGGSAYEEAPGIAVKIGEMLFRAFDGAAP